MNCWKNWNIFFSLSQIPLIAQMNPLEFIEFQLKQVKALNVASCSSASKEYGQLSRYARLSLQWSKEKKKKTGTCSKDFVVVIPQIECTRYYWVEL